MCGSRYRRFKSNKGKIPKGVWHLGGMALVRHTKKYIYYIIIQKIDTYCTCSNSTKYLINKLNKCAFGPTK